MAYTFDPTDRLSSERLFWDRVSVVVLSVQMEHIWLQSITKAKRKPIKATRKRKRMGLRGVTVLLAFHSRQTGLRRKGMPSRSSTWIETSPVNRVKSKKYFWLSSPTQLLTQGQWWSFLRMQRPHTMQW